MTPENRIKQALKVADAGGMMQFNKDSMFAHALRALLAKIERLEKAND